MIRTSRKLEIVAAACYAGCFVLWVLGSEYKIFEPEFGRGQELTAVIYEIQRASTLIEGWEATSLALLLIALALTVAAIRMRKSSENF